MYPASPRKSATECMFQNQVGAGWYDYGTYGLPLGLCSTILTIVGTRSVRLSAKWKKREI